MSSFQIEALLKSFANPKVNQSFCDLYECLGLITAVASCPDKVPASEWVEQIARHPEKPVELEDPELLKQLTSQLVAWWQYCESFFDHGQQLILPSDIGLTENAQPNLALIQFASGYIRGYGWLVNAWQHYLPDSDTEAARSLMVLNLILSRFVNEEAVAKSEPEAFQQLPDVQGCLKALPTLLSAVGMLGKDLAQSDSDKAQQPIDAPYINQLKNVGRNDLCPCGSGKKFKRCCLH